VKLVLPCIALFGSLGGVPYGVATGGGRCAPIAGLPCFEANHTRLFEELPL
jgi:hypothetical protein